MAQSPRDGSLGTEDATAVLARQHDLEARFRLHKQHRKDKERRVQQTRATAAVRASRHAAATPLPGPPLCQADARRVDHHNRPYRWKLAQEVVAEHERRKQHQALTAAAPVRRFPGPCRPFKLPVTPLLPLNEAKEGVALEDEPTEPLDPSLFPLHRFDSHEYETHSPSEWLATTRTGQSLYYTQQEWQWRPCTVLHYHAAREQYLIQFQGSDVEKYVHRINLSFDTEAVDGFAHRVAAARARQAQAKAWARFDACVTRQDPSRFRGMPRATLERIHARVVAGLPARVAVVDGHPAASLLRQLTDAAIAAYLRSLKKTAVLMKLRQDPAWQARFARLALDVPVTKVYGKVAVPTHDFDGNRQRLKTLLYIASPPLLAILRRLYAGWEKTFHTVRLVWRDDDPAAAGTAQRPFRVLDFQALQATHSNQVAERFVIEWRRAVVDTIIDKLQDHFDLFVSDLKVYDQSRLKRLLTGLHLRLAAQWRHVVQQSIHDWMRFVRRCTASNVDDALAAKPSVQPVTGPRPLFRLQLALVQDEVVVTPSVQDVTAALVDPLDAIVSTVHELDRLECDVLTLLAVERRPLLDLSRERDGRWEWLTALEHAKTSVQQHVADAMASAEALARDFTAFAASLRFDTSTFLATLQPLQLADFDVVPHDEAQPRQDLAYLPRLCRQIRHFHDLAQRVDALSLDVVAFPLVSVATDAVKHQLRTQALTVRDTLLASLVRDARGCMLGITARYTALLSRMTAKPANEAQFARLQQVVGESKAVVTAITREVAVIHERLAVLDEFAYRLSMDDFLLAHAVNEWPRKIAEAGATCDATFESEKGRMMELLALEKEAFELEVDRYGEAVRAFRQYSDIAETDKYVEEAGVLLDALHDARLKATDLNARETVLGVPLTAYTSLLTALDAEFAPYHQLWTLSAEFSSCCQTWLHGPFLELESTAIETFVTASWHSASVLSASLDAQGVDAVHVARKLGERIAAFQAYLPVIQSLASPAIQARHWDTLRQTVGFDEPEDDLTLQRLLDRHLMDHLDTTAALRVVAEKEYALQATLSGMLAEWDSVTVATTRHGETGTYVVHNADALVALLDEHLVQTQTMRASPYVACLDAECLAWETTLQAGQHVLDAWMACQRTWVALEAIFRSDDLMRQLPTEARRFASVDAFWRKLMDETVAMGAFLAVAAMDQVLAKFQRANEKLDDIQKGLLDYLEMKRVAFPRFYFVSNAELLALVSQSTDPRAVQAHLAKCFEGIDHVTFALDPLGITAMHSVDGEGVPLTRVVHPDSEANRGKVERWLAELEERQYETMRDQLARAIGAYACTDRETWLLAWPAQVVLAVSQIYWTQDVTRALTSDRGRTALDEYGEVLKGQLNTLVELVRGHLTQRERTTVGALVVLDVHARDTLASMVATGVESAEAFEWIAQLRSYWTEQARGWDVELRMVTACVGYGDEYLGTTTRLVITPLTDRCYRTLLGAVALVYGGAPEGPAGTGKTETVKDLSKASGMHCVVFNGSDSLDALATAKLLKGVAGSGAWCCLDECNRMPRDVLSVLAHQLSTVLDGKRTQATHVVLEGTVVPLHLSANVFITMNPGYAGRAELPANLHALFRPCAMMVPDYALIAEIRLHSLGFAHAQSHARKLTHVLHVASEQLSSQPHYDYGMRAVTAILVAASALRHRVAADPQWTDATIVLQALHDVTLPQLTAADLPLFHAITLDLFSGLVVPSLDRTALVAAIHATCARGIAIVPDVVVPLECPPAFVRKVVQVYETVQVRHGLMLVGTPGAGKTCVVQTLARALTASSADARDPDRVLLYPVNPKAVTSEHLYGYFHPSTHEWVDGVVACTYRACARASGTAKQWLVFDGPVDAVWIENLNTVLDDTKRLCLLSGEVIPMTDRMRLVFETDDVDAASPATISRVGMVFLDPHIVTWDVLVHTWVRTRLSVPLTVYQSFLDETIQWLVPPLLYLVEHHCTVPTPVTARALTASFLRVLECALDDGVHAAHVAGEAHEMEAILECVLLQAVVWSIGACIDSTSRYKFDGFFRALLASKLTTAVVPIGDQDGTLDAESWTAFVAQTPGYTLPTRVALLPFPDTGLVYDYCFDLHRKTWMPWREQIEGEAFHLPPSASFTQLLVPTVDSVRHDWLLDTLIEHGVHVLCTGETGTGKSVTLQKKVRMGTRGTVEGGQWTLSLVMHFSAHTRATQTQDLMEAKLEQRRNHVLGPPVGQKCVIFVDDLNLPAKETYGAQPPLELLRQWMGYGGWYNRKDNAWTQVKALHFLAAMGPPGGGRTRITQRYVRYFNLVHFVPFDKEALGTIFTCLTEWFLAPFEPQVQALKKALVMATLDLYTEITHVLLPTPAKSHYTFNLRDLSKVFQGVAQVSSETIQDGNDLVRLWAHECSRVFADRLIDDLDRGWLAESIEKMMHLHWYQQEVPIDALGAQDVVRYGHFGTNGKHVYHELPDRYQVQSLLQKYLDEYNQTSAAPMRLVLFQDAVDHITRISRILHQPRGNALLIGMSGSGRKSLTKLAAFIAGYHLYQIEASTSYARLDWYADLKKVCHLSGVQNQPTVLLLSDTQLKDEAYLADVNAFVNTGEVATLWTSDELVAIKQALEATARESTGHTSPDVYQFFVTRCRQNLHLVLAFSPLGDAFRRRVRTFPSLVQCCTIDWFPAWPPDALEAVAASFLAPLEFSPSVRANVVAVCVAVQASVRALSRDYHHSLRRYHYVTSTSFLDFLQTFQTLVLQQRQHVMTLKERYTTGWHTLVATAEHVAAMQSEFEAWQPLLHAATRDVEAVVATLAHEQQEASATRAHVHANEAQCTRQAAAAQALKASCEADVADAVPVLARAVQALQTLSKSDLTEMKAMKNPPEAVKLVMEAVCTLLRVPPVQGMHDGVTKSEDYWAPAKKVLNDARFLQTLVEYDKEHIPEEAMAKLCEITKNPEFQAEKIRTASVAASGLCSWVHAMVGYDRVVKAVAPKREALQEATSALERAQTELVRQQEALAGVVAKVVHLEAQVTAAGTKKHELEEQVAACSLKLTRATQLINGLSTEQARWEALATRLQRTYENVVGDMMVAAGTIAYLGAFPSPYRDRAKREWTLALTQQVVPCTTPVSVIGTLGHAVTIQEWTMAKLPNDAFSIENAILVHSSQRWPLMIDPDAQATRWVKEMTRPRALKVLTMAHSGFVRTLETSLLIGAPVLLENLTEIVDPILDPLLLKQVVHTGTGTGIRLGDSIVPYDDTFCLYLATKLRNPHYGPEVCAKVNVVNFMATAEGIQDQLLHLVVAAEAPQLEQERVALLAEDVATQKRVHELEDEILSLVQLAPGTLLADDRLIETLQVAKATASQMADKGRATAATHQLLVAKRHQYLPVAAHAAPLFFCLADLSGLDPMYEFALEWFLDLFLASISRAEPSAVFSTRVAGLKDTFTWLLYQRVSCALFAKHKLVFAFLLTVQLLEGNGTLDRTEVRYFLSGNTQVVVAKRNPFGSRTWVSDQLWANVVGLDQLPSFAGFSTAFEAEVAHWDRVYTADDPAAALAAVPAVATLDAFQRLLVLRCIRPDQVVPALVAFVAMELGPQYIEPRPFSLHAGYDAATCATPLILVLSPGADPTVELRQFALAKNMHEHFVTLSLGQAQGPVAEAAIADASEHGTWVCLANCHLAASWLPTLASMCADLTPDRVHASFRLWLTTEPTTAFPSSLLHYGVKLTHEAPTGVRAQLKEMYEALDDDWFATCARPHVLKTLLFRLCCFHAVVRARTHFGPLGWNRAYGFAASDLAIATTQLKEMLEALRGEDPVPFRTLAYLAGECHYGGRVTDERDRRCLLTLVDDVYTPALLSSSCSLSGMYDAPSSSGAVSDVLAYIDQLPRIDGPEVFGLHANASISTALADTKVLLEAALSMQPRGPLRADRAMNWEQRVEETARDIAVRLPRPFDVAHVARTCPVGPDAAMNTVLIQEVGRLNRLLTTVQRSLDDVHLAIKGLVVLSAELEAMGESLVNGHVPARWSAVAYPSLKPLGSWVKDLLARVAWVQKWVVQGHAPPVFWVAGFVSPHAFLTGTLQTYARKHKVPIDQVSFDTIVLTRAAAEVTRPAEEGAYVDGLYLEGAGWDVATHALAEMRPRELHVQSPVLHLLPKPRDAIEPVEDTDPNGTAHVYLCPVYKTSQRQGTLSTTGQSTNFVMMVRLPMRREHRQSHWIKRGVALLTQLDT